MNKKDKIEQLKNQGWENMESLLDEHLPENNTRRKGGIWWIAAASVLLLIAIPFLVYRNQETTPPSYTFTSKDILSTENNTDKSIRPSTPITKDINESDFSGNNPLSFPSPKNEDRESDDVSIVDQKSPLPESSDIASNTIKGQQVKISPLEKNTSPLQIKESGIAENWRNTDYQPTATGSKGLTYLPTPSPNIHYFQQLNVEQNPATFDISGKSKTWNLRAMAFAESTWAFADNFGFLSLGPGIVLKKGKWTGKLAAGFSLPLPARKSISSVESNFSEKYNFSSPEFDQNNVTQGNSSSIYQRHYQSKPGFTIRGSLQYQVIPQLSIGVKVGHFLFKYNYEQTASGNQIPAKISTQPESQNSILYSGLSMNYHLNSHISISIGGNLLNIDDMENAFLVPAFGLQYVL
ncbi:hypothetical protein [Membranihabitans maritimus]|uniref:hypothetical protein n=1 Tax=Membranihabitans maritimus TaxID=2904244 RepID=UPI001F310800|nr:hypothetical protein [Membranihabitans maritimus]